MRGQKFGASVEFRSGAMHRPSGRSSSITSRHKKRGGRVAVKQQEARRARALIDQRHLEIEHPDAALARS